MPPPDRFHPGLVPDPGGGGGGHLLTSGPASVSHLHHNNAYNHPRGRQWSPQRHGFSAKPPRIDYKDRKASTMDSDKKRLFLERMRANPFHNPMASGFHYGGQQESFRARQQCASPNSPARIVHPISPGGGQFYSANSRSHSNESRNSRNCNVRSDSFYVKEAPSPNRFDTSRRGKDLNFSNGFRSLSNDSRRSNNLFGDGEDDDHPPLQMSSIDGVSTQVIKRRAQSGDVLDTIDGEDAMADEEPFLSINGVESQFSLSTPDFGKQVEQVRSEASQHQEAPNTSTLKKNKGNSKQVVANTNGSVGSYSSLRNKIKSVQERYKTSSSKFRAKFSSKGSITNISSPIQANPGPKESMSSAAKFRSHSHGALDSLDEFQMKQQLDEQEETLRRKKKPDKSKEVTKATIEAPPRTDGDTSDTSANSQPSTPRMLTAKLPMSSKVSGGHRLLLRL